MAKVLVVDDSMTVLVSLKRLLEENGHVVIPAQDGLTTLSMLMTNTPEIILLDIGLPGVSGLDICVAIKHMPEYEAIPIIVITGSRRQFDELLARRLGVVAYLQKPINPQQLLDIVNESAAKLVDNTVSALNLGVAAAS